MYRRHGTNMYPECVCTSVWHPARRDGTAISVFDVARSYELEDGRGVGMDLQLQLPCQQGFALALPCQAPVIIVDLWSVEQVCNNTPP